MRIGIDGNEGNVQAKVGIGEYAFELLQEFKECKIPHVTFEIYLKTLPRNDLPKEDERWRYRIVGPGKLWTQIGLPLDLFLHKPRPDVFFTPTHYAPRFSPVPTVVSVMDVSYMHFPELFRKSDLYQLQHWTAYSVKNAKAVITISKASKNDIIRIYNVPDEKVVVTYPGIKKMAEITDNASYNQLLSEHRISQKYILFVGTLQPRKNLQKLIEAFAKISVNHDDLHLVIIGKKGWLFEDILSAPEKYGVEEKVKFLFFVPNEILPFFYKNALFFILPSLYEGFGLPVLESMQYGCPVIASNVSSLPEAGGDAALYVDPKNVGDIAQKMEVFISEEAKRQEYIAKGYNQVKKFSWEKTAHETLNVLMEIGGK